jgi:hypothetical protein
MITLYITDILPSLPQYDITWDMLLFSSGSKLCVYTYSFIGAVRLLRLIREYSVMKPVKLVWSIYILIGIILIMIPFYLALLAEVAIQIVSSSKEILSGIYVIGTNLCEILPIAIFMMNCKLLKKFTAETFLKENELRSESESSDAFILTALSPSRVSKKLGLVSY